MSDILIVNCCPVKNGATAEIVNLLNSHLNKSNDVKCVCIDDYKIDFCKGCRSCHKTAKCFHNDDTAALMSEFDWADKIICVSPSYWADVPGQFKAFIDRCTPWCNTHEPHAKLKAGKKGYAVALRTGTNIAECEKIIHTIEHFYGHLEIEMCVSLGLCAVEHKEDVNKHIDEIIAFCEKILCAGDNS